MRSNSISRSRTNDLAYRLLTLAVLVSMLSGLFLTSPAQPALAAPPTELFISEYIEGSSYNKAIEIYNETGASIDLATGGYALLYYFNGSSTPGLTINLTGPVANDDVYVVAQASADPLILAQADQTSTSTSWFNGDDAVELRKGAATVDVIGQIGFDPGSEWGTGLTSTADNTIRRKSTICAGDTNGTNAFDPSIEWDGYATNTFDGLGTHTTTCTRRLTISDVSLNEGNSGTTSFDFTVSLNAPAEAGGVTFDIATADGTATTADNDYASNSVTGATIAAGSSTYTFSVTVNGDTNIEGNETFFVNVTNVTGANASDSQGQGTIQEDDLPNLTINDVSLVEGNAGTTSFNFTVSLSVPAGPGGVSFDIATQDNTATTADNDYASNSVTGATIAAGSSTYTFSVLVNGDATPEPDETFFVDVANVTGANVADGQGQGTIVDDDGYICTLPFTPIYQIQGSGASTPIPGNVTTQGVVVGDFEGYSSAPGFYLQDAAGDGVAATSDGIFVYTGADTVSVGQVVRVTGYARERYDQTTLNGSNSNSSAVPAANIVDCGTGSVAATDVTMPFADTTSDPERYEGMLVRFPQPLVISEYFNYDYYGEIVLALPLPGEPRAFTGTAIDEPGTAANDRTLANTLRRITLDDVNSTYNPPTLRHPNGLPFALDNRFRGGDTVQNAVGILGYEYSKYRIFPTGPGDYTAANPRPAAPEPVGGSVRVAAMNTLNFFLTADYPTGDPLDNKCGPLTNMECRGWDSNQPTEFTRQRDKLLQALVGLNADVIGLNEIENTTGVEPLADIVAGLNAILGAGTYAYIDTGVIGTDAIKVGMIYKPSKVTPVGAFQTLDSLDDPRFLDTRNRPSLAQTFQDVTTGDRFTVVVNHLKSKGSACTGDPDIGDGQGNCNLTREAAAQALVDWLAGDPTGSGDPDFLIMGDLNSYAMEDPIDAIKAGSDDTAGTGDDYTNLIAQFGGTYAYSYVFDGQAGYLDHALASPAILPQVTGATEWHINADEPDLLDYDTTYKPPEQEALYEPNQYRTSDHDAVIVGLAYTTDPTATGLATPAAVIQGETTLLTVNVTPGQYPTSSNLEVEADLSAIGGSPSQVFYDDGTHGDATAGDNVFSFAYTVPLVTVPNNYSLPAEIEDDEGRSATTTIALTVDFAPTDPTATGLGTPATVLQGGTTLLTVDVTPGQYPTSTGLAVIVDLSAIGGPAAQVFYDDGTHGDATAGDNVFSFLYTVPLATATGDYSLPATITDAESRSKTTTIDLTVDFAPTDPTATGLAAPATMLQGGTVLLTVDVTPGEHPTSTGLAVTVDLSAIGGPAAQVFYDDGTHGDATAGDNVFSFLYTIALATAAGDYNLPATITDAESRSTTTTIALTVDFAPTDPAAIGLATPSPLTQGSEVLLTVDVTPGEHPTSSDLVVTVDLSSIGGPAAQTFYDDGSHGDEAAGDNVFSFTYIVQFTTASGDYSLPASIIDGEGRTANTTIDLTVAEYDSIALSPWQIAGGNQSILLTWDTIGDRPIRGFNIYRSDSPTNRMIKQNATLIEVQAGGYQFLDQNVVVGQTYYYWVEIVAYDGTILSIPLSASAYYGFYLPFVTK